MKRTWCPTKGKKQKRKRSKKDKSSQSVRWTWGEEQRTAFNKLKGLASPPVLGFPDYTASLLNFTLILHLISVGTSTQTKRMRIKGNQRKSWRRRGNLRSQHLNVKSGPGSGLCGWQVRTMSWVLECLWPTGQKVLEVCSKTQTLIHWHSYLIQSDYYQNSFWKRLTNGNNTVHIYFKIIPMLSIDFKLFFTGIWKWWGHHFVLEGTCVQLFCVCVCMPW